MKNLRHPLLVILLLFTIQLTDAQSIKDHQLWASDKITEAITIDHEMNRAYIGGDFDNFTANVSTALIYEDDTTSYTLKKGPLIGKVLAVEPDGNGGFFIAGDLDYYKGKKISNMIHLNAKGELLPWLPNFNEWVMELSKLDTLLFISGRFTSLNGNSNYRYNTIYDIKNDSFYALNVPTGYLSGGQEHFGADGKNLLFTSSKTFYKLNLKTYAIDKVGIAVNNGGVTAGCYYQGKFYCVGSFTKVNGKSKYRYMEIDTAGYNVIAGTPDFVGDMYDVEVYGSKIVLAGKEIAYSYTAPKKGIMCLDRFSYFETVINGNIPTFIRRVKKYDSRLWMCGNTGQFGSVKSNYTFALDTGQLKFFQNGPPTDMRPEEIAYDKGNLVLTAIELGLKYKSRGKFAAVDITKDEILTTPKISGLIRDIGFDKKYVYLVGGVTKLADTFSTEGIGILDRIDFKPQAVKFTVKKGAAAGSVYRCASDNTHLYVAGDFDNINGQSVGPLARIEIATWKVDTKWSPTLSLDHTSGARTLELFDNVVAVGGWLASGSEEGLIFFNKKTAKSLNYNINAESTHSFAKEGKDIYIGGQFDKVLGDDRLGMAAFTIQGGKCKLKNWNKGSKWTLCYGIGVAPDYIFLGHYGNVPSPLTTYDRRKSTFNNLTPEMYVGDEVWRMDYEKTHLITTPRDRFRNTYFINHLVFQEAPTVKQLSHKAGVCNKQFSDTSAFVISDANGENINVWFASNDTSILSLSDVDTFWKQDTMHLYVKAKSKTGTVKLSIFTTDGVDTTSLKLTFNVLDAKKITLSGTQHFCSGDSTEIEVNESFGGIKWSNAKEGQKTFYKNSGRQWVIGETTIGCISDTTFFSITENKPPKPVIDSNSIFSTCVGDTVWLIDNSNTFKSWNTNYLNPVFTTTDSSVKSATLYLLDTTTQCSADTVFNITWNKLPQGRIATLKTNAYCTGSPVVLKVDSAIPNEIYIWQPGNDTSKNISHVVAKSLTIYLKSKINDCSIIDSISLLAKPMANTQIFCPAAVCANQPFPVRWKSDGQVTTTPSIDTNNFMSTPYDTFIVFESELNGCITKDTSFIQAMQAAKINTPSFDQKVNLLSTTKGFTKYTWFLDGQQFAQTDSAFVVVMIQGWYKVQALDSNGCLAKSDSMMVKIDGINPSQSNQFSLYPNPSNGSLHLQFASPSKQYVVTIFDISGKAVANTFATGSLNLDLGHLLQGMYLIKVKTENGLNYYQTWVKH